MGHAESVTRLEDLEDERSELQQAVDDTGEELDTALFRAFGDDTAQSVSEALERHRDAIDALDEWDHANGAELAALEARAELAII